MGCASSLQGLSPHTIPVSQRDPNAVPRFDHPSRVAASRPTPGLVSAPRPFGWTTVGMSTGRRPFRTARIGDGDFRVLVIGSVGGDDPLAIAAVDHLARALHSDTLILGGFQADVIRTLNPDGAATGSKLNALGEYVNHGFPRGDASRPRSTPGTPPLAEVRFLLERCRSLRPQRIIHIRTVSGDRGLVGYSERSRTSASEVAAWLNFRTIDLSKAAVEGSLERYFAANENADVVMFGIPDQADPDTLWQNYGDALLNLMLEDDFATRELVRRQQKSESADRRNAEP